MGQETEKTRYSDEELQEFKELIGAKLERAKQQLIFYMQQVEEMADNQDSKIKGLGDANIASESEQLSSMVSRQIKHIQHLENALIRIENRAFGICRVTGKLISKERLKVVPHATLSIDAKQSEK